MHDGPAFDLTESAAAALTQHFGSGPRPSLRVFLSFLDESGPRLDLSPDTPTAEDERFCAKGWDFTINRQLWRQAAPVTVDCTPTGIVIHSALDFSQAGGNCGGNCAHEH